MPYLYEAEDDEARVFSEDQWLVLHGFDYSAATEKTASNSFTPTTVGQLELAYALRQVIDAANQMDRYKKALFRKRTRVEAGLSSLLHPDDKALTAHEEEADLFHGIIGMITEVGELAEILEAYLKVPVFDLTNLREEIGDNLWYMARLVKFADTTFLTEMKRNIAKLRARHGETFNKERDGNRDLAAERKLLEE